ncbi:hypothetical protein PAPYR_8677 [Paratrimastix pyriformis]|uniref:Uncharacterized protein n=1 Tax=Paratrimastix pyriformis TaxID=342808 RepID=A0ABQ8UDJ0_9EUKA|nr:hypothetical protein PAPYR_8677 [Paratrimastix pyriformis]
MNRAPPDLTGQVESKTKHLAELTTRAALLRKQLDDLIDHPESSADPFPGRARTIEYLSQLSADTLAQRTRLEREGDTLRQRFAEKEAEYAALAEQLVLLRSQEPAEAYDPADEAAIQGPNGPSTSAAAGTLSVAAREELELGAEQVRLEARLVQLQEALRTERTQRDSIATLRGAEAAELRAQLRQAQQEAAAAQAHRDRARGDPAVAAAEGHASRDEECPGLVDPAAGIERENGRLRDEAASLAAELAQLAPRRSLADRLQDELDAYQRRVAGSQLRAAQAQHAHRMAAAAQRSSLLEHDLQAAERSRLADRAAHEGRLAAVRADLEALRARLGTGPPADIIAATEARLRGARGQASELDADVRICEGRVASIRQAIERATRSGAREALAHRQEAERHKKRLAELRRLADATRAAVSSPAPSAMPSSPSPSPSLLLGASFSPALRTARSASGSRSVPGRSSSSTPRVLDGGPARADPRARPNGAPALGFGASSRMRLRLSTALDAAAAAYGNQAPNSPSSGQPAPMSPREAPVAPPRLPPEEERPAGIEERIRRMERQARSSPPPPLPPHPFGTGSPGDWKRPMGPANDPLRQANDSSDPGNDAPRQGPKATLAPASCSDAAPLPDGPAADGPPAASALAPAAPALAPLSEAGGRSTSAGASVPVPVIRSHSRMAPPGPSQPPFSPGPQRLLNDGPDSGEGPMGVVLRDVVLAVEGARFDTAAEPLSGARPDRAPASPFPALSPRSAVSKLS